MAESLQQATNIVFTYHERTKHHLNRYAAGPNGLDWADQPDPFRRFEGCEQIQLPMPGANLPVQFTDLTQPKAIPNQPLNLESLGLFLELSLGLSAWKQYESDRWALRCNPSSGNLHPTEAYLINTESDLLKPGVYHYVSHDHALEKRCEFSLDNHQKPASIFVALSSIHWREAWKYGERAFRYCQHDIGHALGSLRYAAAVLGWSLELMAECGDDELGKLLGLNRHDDFIHHENEAPDLLCRIRCKSDDNLKASFDSLLSQARDGLWSGQAEKLSVYHQNHWPIIDEVAIATHKPHTEEPAQSENWQINPSHWSEKSATAMIQQRRSAQRFDGMSFLPQADFIRLLGSVMPTNQIPFDVWRWPPRIHLLLFVHRVENVKPGLYLLPRDNAVIPKLRAAMTDHFEWQPIELEVESLPLFRLVVANCQRAAKTLSCHQDIASDGAFSLAMLAEFQQSVSAAPWQYRHLFWETGLIGQSLYLEAEAVGMRGTGIGCFFDDSVHETLGLKNNNFQSLYHFTVGKPLEDSRLQTLPAYAHLGRNFPG